LTTTTFEHLQKLEIGDVVCDQANIFLDRNTVMTFPPHLRDANFEKSVRISLWIGTSLTAYILFPTYSTTTTGRPSTQSTASIPSCWPTHSYTKRTHYFHCTSTSTALKHLLPLHSFPLLVLLMLFDFASFPPLQITSTTLKHLLPPPYSCNYY
jgi:hypothetical protein